MGRCRLLAIDLDGTLVRDDGVVAAEDREAIDQARRRGMAVTFATGRLAPGALPLARALGIETPLVCGDGAATVCPRTAALLAVVPLSPGAVERVLALEGRRAVFPFFFAPHAVLAAPSALAVAPLVGWSPHTLPGAALRDALLGCPAVPVIAAFLVGEESDVRAAAQEIAAEAEGAVEGIVFPVTGTAVWALRLGPPQTTKAVGLERLALTLGLGPGEVAVIGDWYNDIAMFRWARRSYVMGQAPEPVLREASHRLRATARTGGGVAEAVEHILKQI